MHRIVPTILSGGSGSRLWPVSRMMCPKQLLPLVSDRSMLQETALRVGSEFGFAPPIIVCNERHRFMVAEQLRDAGVQPHAILLEPTGKNTAPAAILAAARIVEDDEDALILLLPSDHAIEDSEAFRDAIALGRKAASQGNFVTFGIRPNAPKTGYGYIRRGAPVDGLEDIYSVDAFIEKPNENVARAYLETGEYYWNSGIFLFPAKILLEEAENLLPEAYNACRAAIRGRQEDFDFERPDAEAFARSPSISIDYGIMEKTKRAAVLPVDMGWNDVGTWSSLWELEEKDAEGNSVRGDAILESVSNSMIRADAASVAAVGVDDLIIVTTKDFVLVAAKDQAQQVGQIVEKLKDANRSEHLDQTIVHRPWGSFETVDAGDRFQVKRLTVRSGAKLSLQKHAHRSEHWVVVQGTAQVVRGDQEFILQENESVYIPVGTVHRLANPGEETLHVVEVQIGSYLGEDDIVRIEDTYGRGTDD